MADDALERGTGSDIGAGKLGRIFVEDGGHGLGAGMAFEGALAAKHFVEDAAEAEDVGTVVDGYAANLFGGHVAECSENLSGVGLGGDDGSTVHRVERLAGAELGQAEIEDFDLAAANDENVFGF